MPDRPARGRHRWKTARSARPRREAEGGGPQHRVRRQMQRGVERIRRADQARQGDGGRRAGLVLMVSRPLLISTACRAILYCWPGVAGRGQARRAVRRRGRRCRGLRPGRQGEKSQSAAPALSRSRTNWGSPGPVAECPSDARAAAAASSLASTRPSVTRFGVGEARRVGEADIGALDHRRQRQLHGDRPAHGELPPGRLVHRRDDRRRVAVRIEPRDQDRDRDHRQGQNDDHAREGYSRRRLAVGARLTGLCSCS